MDCSAYRLLSMLHAVHILPSLCPRGILTLHIISYVQPCIPHSSHSPHPTHSLRRLLDLGRYHSIAHSLTQRNTLTSSTVTMGLSISTLFDKFFGKKGESMSCPEYTRATWMSSTDMTVDTIEMRILMVGLDVSVYCIYLLCSSLPASAVLRAWIGLHTPSRRAWNIER